MPWYSYAITQPHSIDDGVDVGTPNDTPLTMPFAGIVEDASYHDYGGQVVVDVPGTGYSEYTIHMDNIAVQPGERITPQTVIGTSGGGVGDKVLHHGRVQPAQSQSWFDGHSSNYHTEYGIFEGENMNAFNEGWGNKSRQLDPTGVLAQLSAGQAPAWPGSGAQPTAQPSGPHALASLATTLTDPLTGVPGWLTGIAGSLGSPDVGSLLGRLAVGGVGIAAVLIGVFVVLQPDVQAVEDHYTERAAKVIRMVGSAA